MPIGSDRTRLIVLRGNTGSGKSTVAAALREAYGRGMAQTSTLQQTVEVILGETQVLAGAPKDSGHESSRHQIGYRADVVSLLRVVGQAVGPDEAAPNTAVSDHHPLP